MKKLPHISPLTLTRRREPFDHADWVFELKQDGFRGMAYIGGGKSKLLSRTDHVERYGCDFFKMICEKNLEGIVAKHRESRYDKSAKWIKMKNPNYTQAERRNELFESTFRGST